MYTPRPYVCPVPGHESSRRATMRALWIATVILGIATLSGVGRSEGTLAAWTDAEPVASGVVTSGHAALTLTGSLNSAGWSNLLTGESVRQSVSVTNTGTVELLLDASATPVAGAEVRVARGACGAVIGGATAQSSPTALGALAAGASTTICVQVTIPATASPATSAAFTLTVRGVQS